jgi:hypothetical protein
LLIEAEAFNAYNRPNLLLAILAMCAHGGTLLTY